MIVSAVHPAALPSLDGILPAETAAPGPGTAKQSHAMRYVRRFRKSTVSAPRDEPKRDHRGAQEAQPTARGQYPHLGAPLNHRVWSPMVSGDRCKKARWGERQTQMAFQISRIGSALRVRLVDCRFDLSLVSGLVA